MVLCSCVVQNSIRTSLPTDVPLIGKIARGDNLYLSLDLEGGEKLLFMVDTGCPQTILDKSLEPKLGECLGRKTIHYGLYGNSVTRAYAAPRLYLGNAQLLTGRRVFTDNLRERKIIGPAVAGILGMDCLRHYCIQLDFTAMRMRFLDPDHHGDEDLGNAYPLTMFFNCVFTCTDLSGTGSMWFRIDSGFIGGIDFILKTRPFQRELNKQTPMLLSESETATGRLERLALFSKVSFGGVPYTNLAFMVKKGMAWPVNNNCVGLGFLSRNLVTFNFPKRIMYLKPVTTPLFAQGGLIMFKATECLMSLEKKGQLPGWLKGETGIFRWPNGMDFDGKYPVSRTIDGQKHGNASGYHYIVVQSSSDSVWKLQRAWRTDANGRLIEEYSVQ